MKLSCSTAFNFLCMSPNIINNFTPHLSDAMTIIFCYWFVPMIFFSMQRPELLIGIVLPLNFSQCSRVTPHYTRSIDVVSHVVYNMQESFSLS